MAEVNKVGEKTVIKFEKEEIDKIQKFKNDYADVTAKLGELEIELLVFEQQKKQLDSYKEQLQQKYLQLRGDEVKLANELKEKYGDGEFDIGFGGLEVDIERHFLGFERGLEPALVLRQGEVGVRRVLESTVLGLRDFC